MLARLAEFRPELVFNAAEGFYGKADLDYLIPALVQAEGSRRLSTLAFFGEPGFRGRYGFYDAPDGGAAAR